MKQNKVVIFGSAKYVFDEDDYDALTDAKIELPIDAVVVSSCNYGLFPLIREWARKKRLPVIEVPVDKQAHASTEEALHASHIAIAEIADAMIAFPGGEHTKDLIHCMKDAGKEVWDWRRLAVRRRTI